METGIAVKTADVSQLAPAKCPLTAALNAIGGKWSLIRLYWLDSGTRRFNELRRLMPEIPTRSWPRRSVIWSMGPCAPRLAAAGRRDT
jgi:hypothetical protein